VSNHFQRGGRVEGDTQVQAERGADDINLPGINGVECFAQLKSRSCRARRSSWLTVYQNTEHIFNALAAGATGYMLKQTPPVELIAAIKEVNAADRR